MWAAVWTLCFKTRLSFYLASPCFKLLSISKSSSLISVLISARSKPLEECECAECVTYSTNYQQGLILGSWYTNSEQEPLNQRYIDLRPFQTRIKGINTIWWRLFTQLWRVPLRYLKRESPTTVFLKTTLTQTITQDKQLMLLGLFGRICFPNTIWQQ